MTSGEYYDYYPLTGVLKSAAHVLNGTEISTSTLTYNETGTVNTIGLMEGGSPSNAARAFAYDVSDRLTDTYSAKLANGIWTRDAKLQSVSHDTLGNITSKSDVGTYKYEKPGNPYAVTSAGATTFQYDNLGRQTNRGGTQGSKGFTKIAYASHGQPIKVTTLDSGDVRYAYNGSLERVLSSSNDSTTVYINDLYSRKTSKSDPTSRTHIYSVKAHGQTVAEVVIEERNNAMVGTPQVRLIRNDHLGSASLAADTTNAVTRTHYDAFGKTQETSASLVTAFAGYVNEPTSALLRMGVRMYDPNLGVVLTPDPIASDKAGQDSLNPYAYAFNRPTTFRDPTGMTPDFFGANFTLEAQAYFSSLVDSVYPQLAPSIQQGIYNSLVTQGLEPLANQVVAYYNAGNYALLYGDYYGNWLFQTSAGQQALTNAQNACMGAAYTSTALAVGFAALGLAGASTFMGYEIGVPALSSYLRMGVTDALVAGEAAAPAVGQAFQAEENVLQGVATRFGPMNQGPLAQNVVSTFRGGSYSEITLSEATTLYRAYGGEAGPMGRYWTTTMPGGPMQAQMDLALVPSWGNTATQFAAMQVPAGTQVYAGYAAPQYTGVTVVSGGGVQVYVPNVDFTWLLRH